jgi:excisionase family DNA binding protein
MIELNGENYLTGNEACHLLGVKVSTLYTYVSRGVLRSYKQGIKRQSLYKKAELEALLELRPSTAPSPIADAGAGTGTEVGQADDRYHIPHAEDWVPNV